MAGKEGDVFEKNSCFHKNWKVLFSFDVGKLSSTGTLHFEWFYGPYRLLHG